MAAYYSQSRGIASVVGKRFLNQKIRNATLFGGDRFNQLLPSSTAASIRSKGVHTSVYDKNIDDQARPSVVPDDHVIEAQSDKYWEPNPHTGVFGPVTTEHQGAGGERTYHTQAPPPNANAQTGTTVLEQQAWFRPLEDVEKPRLP